MKIRPVGAELCHADGQTDTAMLTAALRNFANPPKRREKENVLLISKVKLYKVHAKYFSQCRTCCYKF
jgi:hypothetical protein